jgi:hypothetical protein
MRIKELLVEVFKRDESINQGLNVIAIIDGRELKVPQSQ